MSRVQEDSAGAVTSGIFFLAICQTLFAVLAHSFGYNWWAGAIGATVALMLLSMIGPAE